MATCTIQGIRIAGLSSAVPEPYQTQADLARVFGEDESRKISESTGVVKRHLSEGALCTSDLCQAAAVELLPRLGWEPASVDALIFVSQTPDYVLPATSCCLHARLGLSKGCACFDVNLGCSGHVYGTWLAATIMAAGAARRALVLCGDTGPHISPLDRSAFPLFGEAGTATALVSEPGAAPMYFDLGTDGTGAANLIVPAGGFRRRPSAEGRVQTEREGGNIRSDEELFMNGAEIFAFTLREVPPLVRRILAMPGWPLESVDAYVFHQANRFMLQHLARKLKLPPDRFIVDLEDYGNTSSASIPLAVTNKLRPALSERGLRLVLAGFGVGYSWGALAVDAGPCVVCSPVHVPVPGGKEKQRSELT